MERPAASALRDAPALSQTARCISPRAMRIALLAEAERASNRALHFDLAVRLGTTPIKHGLQLHWRDFFNGRQLLSLGLLLRLSLDRG